MKQIVAEQLKDLFCFDLNAGLIYWKNVSKYHVEKQGTEAGNAQQNTTSKKAYWVVSIDRKKVKRSKIIYYLGHGNWPTLIDHIDGNSLSDSIDNLRIATVERNSWNRKVGRPDKALPMGVRITKSSGKYSARIGYRKKLFTIGTYDTIKLAHDAYLIKRKELYEDFA
jgi:hypothetical protein